MSVLILKKLLIHDSNEIDNQYQVRFCGARATLQRILLLHIRWHQFANITELKRDGLIFLRVFFEKSPERSGKMFQERSLLHESPWNLLNGKKQSKSEITHHSCRGTWQMLARSHETSSLCLVIISVLEPLSRNFRCTAHRHFVKSLVLFQTKLCDIPYAIYYFQTWRQNWYFVSALKLVMHKFWFWVWLDIKTYTAI